MSTNNSNAPVKLGTSQKVLLENDVGNPDITKEKDTIKYHTILNSFMDNKVENTKNKKIFKFMNEQVTTKYSEMAPHVNGYYYIHMVPGPWVNTLKGEKGETFELTDAFNFAGSDLSYVGKSGALFDRVLKQFGQLATDIDIPQINIEYESVSGRSRNLNYASKVHFAGDFSINFLENFNNDIFRYHESWFKYIDALKKGFLKSPTIKNSNNSEFIDVPYFNAVWVAVYAPFTTNIRLLIKIMGVSPINLPFKQVIGDRGKNALTTINQSYKSNDMIYKFYEDSTNQEKDKFFNEFLTDMGDVIKKIDSSDSNGSSDSSDSNDKISKIIANSNDASYNSQTA